MKTLSLVTGATGFIGSHLARALLAQGSRVRVLARDPSRLKVAGVQVVRGDVCGEQTDLDRAAEDCHWVFHCAGAVGEKVTWQRGRAVNAEGTRKVALAARRARSCTFVHVSTIGVYGAAGGTFFENAPRLRTGNPYIDTKIAAEEAVEQVFADTSTHVRIVRPGMVYGPGDTGMMPWLIGGLRKGMPLLGDGQTHVGFVHVSDVVRALIAAAEYAGEERFFNVVGDDDVTWAELTTRLSEALGVSRPRRIPRSLAKALAYSLQAASFVGLAPKPPPVDPCIVKVLTEDRSIPIDRLVGILGARPTVPIAVGLADAIHDIVSAIPSSATVESPVVRPA